MVTSAFFAVCAIQFFVDVIAHRALSAASSGTRQLIAHSRQATSDYVLMPALAVGFKLGRAIGRVLNIPDAAAVRGRFLVTIILTSAMCYFVTGASAQPGERKEASQAAVRILGA